MRWKTKAALRHFISLSLSRASVLFSGRLASRRGDKVSDKTSSLRRAAGSLVHKKSLCIYNIMCFGTTHTLAESYLISCVRLTLFSLHKVHDFMRTERAQMGTNRDSTSRKSDSDGQCGRGSLRKMSPTRERDQLSLCYGFSDLTCFELLCCQRA